MLQNHDLICLDLSAFLLHWQTALISVTCAAIVLEVLTTYMTWISAKKGSMVWKATASGASFGKIWRANTSLCPCESCCPFVLKKRHASNLWRNLSGNVIRSWNTWGFSGLGFCVQGQDVLEPHMSKQTLEFHWGKHHRAYIDNLNKQIDGTDLERKNLEELVKFSYNNENPQACFNNAGQVFHLFIWCKIGSENIILLLGIHRNLQIHELWIVLWSFCTTVLVHWLGGWSNFLQAWNHWLLLVINISGWWWTTWWWGARVDWAGFWIIWGVYKGVQGCRCESVWLWLGLADM